jgi:hypothetical protein
VAGAGPGCQPATQIDRGLLEDLGADRPPPGQPDLHGERAVGVGHEQPPGRVAGLPGVEGIDQVKARPRYPHRRILTLGRQRVGDQPQALVVGKPGRAGMAGQHRRLRPGGVQGVAEGGVPAHPPTPPDIPLVIERMFEPYQDELTVVLGCPQPEVTFSSPSSGLSSD